MRSARNTATTSADRIPLREEIDSSSGHGNNILVMHRYALGRPREKTFLNIHRIVTPNFTAELCFGDLSITLCMEHINSALFEDGIQKYTYESQFALTWGSTHVYIEIY